MDHTTTTSSVCTDHLVSGSGDGYMSKEQMSVADNLQADANSHENCGNDYVDHVEQGIETSERSNLDLVICDENLQQGTSTDSNRQGADAAAAAGTGQRVQISNIHGAIESSVNFSHQSIEIPAVVDFINREADDHGAIDSCQSISECRVCHLSFRESNPFETMKLGCHCKDGLGLAHRNCAEAWFNIKGDRVCEICGVVAENVIGLEDHSSFMEQWNDNGDPTTQNASVTERSTIRQRDFWRSLSLCNFVLACMIVIFILLWLFRISIALR